MKTYIEWIEIENRKPTPCNDILFTDGKMVFAGWLETYEECEDLQFFDALNKVWPDGVTHWSWLPQPVQGG